jgi:hypothetical protein
MLPDGRRGVLGDPLGVSPVARAAVRLRCSVVLVLGEPPAALWGEEDTVEVIGQDERAEPWRYRVTVPGGAPVVLVLVDRDATGRSGPWAGLTGTETAATLRALESVLGVPWGHSTGRTAEHLVLSTHPRGKGGTKLDREPDVPAPARDGIEQPHAMWQRTLRVDELGAGWVHTFDANAAYLGAWQTTELGLGRTHAWAGDVDELRRAGVWRVLLPAGWSEPDDLPAIAPRLRPGRSGWVMTPTLVRLREHAERSGFGELLPEEGHVWARQSRFLRGAGERLRDARAAALAEQAAARARIAAADVDEDLDDALHRLQVSLRVGDGVGELYRVLTGRLGVADAFVSPGWRRPDWGNALRATFRTSLHRKIAGWSVRPFALRTDAVAFVSDEPDPLAFAAAAGLRVGTGLGELKHTGSCPRAHVDELLGRSRLHGGEVFARAAAWHPEVGTVASRA